MKGIYDLFLTRVAEGRKTTVDKIAASAEGRIFSGAKGKKRGLVDTLGGLGAAMARAKELGGLPATRSCATFRRTPRFATSSPAATGPRAERPDARPSKSRRRRAPGDRAGRARSRPRLRASPRASRRSRRASACVCAMPFALIVR